MIVKRRDLSTVLLLLVGIVAYLILLEGRTSLGYAQQAPEPPCEAGEEQASLFSQSNPPEGQIRSASFETSQPWRVVLEVAAGPSGAEPGRVAVESSPPAARADATAQPGQTEQAESARVQSTGEFSLGITTQGDVVEYTIAVCQQLPSSAGQSPSAERSTREEVESPRQVEDQPRVAETPREEQKTPEISTPELEPTEPIDESGALSTDPLSEEPIKRGPAMDELPKTSGVPIILVVAALVGAGLFALGWGIARAAR